jgi:hypothetical protein
MDRKFAVDLSFLKIEILSRIVPRVYQKHDPLKKVTVSSVCLECQKADVIIIPVWTGVTSLSLAIGKTLPRTGYCNILYVLIFFFYQVVMEYLFLRHKITTFSFLSLS